MMSAFLLNIAFLYQGLLWQNNNCSKLPLKQMNQSKFLPLLFYVFSSVLRTLCKSEYPWLKDILYHFWEYPWDTGKFLIWGSIWFGNIWSQGASLGDYEGCARSLQKCFCHRRLVRSSLVMKDFDTMDARHGLMGILFDVEVAVDYLIALTWNLSKWAFWIGKKMLYITLLDISFCYFHWTCSL